MIHPDSGILFNLNPQVKEGHGGNFSEYCSVKRLKRLFEKDTYCMSSTVRHSRKVKSMEAIKNKWFLRLEEGIIC